LVKKRKNPSTTSTAEILLPNPQPLTANYLWFPTPPTLPAGLRPGDIVALMRLNFFADCLQNNT